MAKQDDNILDFKHTVEELNALLKDHASYLDKSADSLAKLNKGYNIVPSEYSNAQTKIKKNNDDIAASQAKINKSLQDTVNALLKEVDALKKQETQIGKNVKLTAEEIVNRRVMNTEKQREATINAELTNEYEKMNAQMNLNIRAAQGMAVTLLQMETAGQKGTAEYNALATSLDSVQSEVNTADAALKKIDATLGRNHRSVGNYKLAYNGLGNSINQITRELPAFTFSAQTGFLALSNNIPILADEIGRLKQKNVELAASGQPVVSVGKQIVSALFSWNTALSLSITLFIVFGKEIAKFTEDLFGMNEGLKQAADSLTDIADAEERYKTTVSETITTYQKKWTELQRLVSVMKDVNKSDEERNDAVKRAKELYPAYLKQLSDEEMKLDGSKNQSAAYAKQMKELTGDILKRVDAESKQGQTNKTLKIAADLKEEVALRERANLAISRLISKKNDDIAQAEAEGQSKGYINAIRKDFENEKQIIIDRITARKELMEDNKEFQEKFNGIGIATSGSSDYLGKEDWLGNLAGGAYSETAITDLKERATAIINAFNTEQAEIDAAFKKTSKLDFKPDKEKAVREKKERTKANQDYLASEFELQKLQLENAIKYNKEIGDNETQSFAYRKAAALQLSNDKIQLAQLEYKEEIRLVKFKEAEDLRINAAELKNKTKSVDDTTAIIKDSQNLELIAFIKLADKRKTIADETAEYLKKVERDIADAVANNLISKDELDNIRQLNLLMENASVRSTAKDFEHIEDLKVNATEDAAQRRLQILIRAKDDEIQVYEDAVNERAAIEKRLGENIGAGGPYTKDVADQIAADKEKLNSRLLMYSKDSKAYADLQKEKLALDKQAEDYRTRKLEEYTGKIKVLGKDFVKSLSEAEANVLQELLDNFKAGLEGAETALDDYIEKLKAIKAYQQSFVDSFGSESGFTTLFDALQGKIAGFGEDFKTTFLTVLEVAQETFNFLAEGSRAAYDSMYADLERQHDSAIRFAGNSAAAKKEIDDQYEKRKKDIDRKKARSDRDLAIFNATINTIQAAVAALPNIPLSIIIGAIGAAQIAAIASTPMPQFFLGRLAGDHKGGPMMVNDGGGSKYRETIKTPDGKILKPQGRNVVMNAPAGTKVYTQDQWEKEVYEQMLNDQSISPASDFMMAAAIRQTTPSDAITADEMDQIMGDHLGNLETGDIYVDEDGFHKRTRKLSDRADQALRNASSITTKV